MLPSWLQSILLRQFPRTIRLRDVQNSTDIWDMVKPICHTLDLDHSHQRYIRSARSFTIEQRYLNAIFWYIAEVCNGGHGQFFSNSSGIVWQDALDGFRAFGMPELADNLQTVLDGAGSSPPFDREERNLWLGRLGEEFEAMTAQCDQFVYDHYDDSAVLAFVKSHPDRFVYSFFKKIFRKL